MIPFLSTLSLTGVTGKAILLGRRLYNDPLHRNSFFLMASTGVMAVVGFFFWIIVSRSYTPEAVGLAGSLISLSGLLISISTLGFPTTLIRFLSTSQKPHQKISTSFALITVMTILVSIAFWFLSSIWLKEIHTLIARPIVFVLFVGAIMVASWDQIIDAIFISRRDSHWVFVESIIFSISKVALAVIFIPLGAIGIFGSNFSALGVVVVVDFFILMFWYKLPFSLKIDRSILSEVWKYTAGSFAIQLIGSLPPQILPAMITRQLGAEQAAYFFLAQTMIAVLWIIPQASSQSLFAESANNSDRFRILALKSIKTQIFLAVIALIGIWLGSDLILSAMGRGYAQGATFILKILSLAIFPIIISNLLSIRLRLTKNMFSLIVITLFSTSVVMISCIFGARHGIIGVATGFVIGQTLTAMVYLVHWWKNS